MRINKFILISLVSSFSLISCGAKINVSTEDEKKGTVSYFINGNKVALQAFPKENYLFTGWFMKNDKDSEYFFKSNSNPFIYETKENVSIQARFEEPSSQAFNFTFNSDTMTFSVSRYHGNDDGDVIIPNTHFGFPVTTIESYTFLNYKNLKSITLQSNIKTINADAFINCSVPTLNINSELELCHDTFLTWTGSQTAYISNSAIIGEVESKPKTKWGWILDRTKDYYTSSSFGNSNPHIVIND